VDARPDNSDARTTLIKALVKLERFDDALREISELAERHRLRRDELYLRGFLERHRGRFRDAVRYYENAYEDGYRGVALTRELAQCHFQLGNLDLARKYIAEAQERQPDNPFVVDLMIQIAIAQRDEETARSLLTILEGVDRPAFVAHRRSRVEGAFGDPEKAFEAAREAVEGQDRPPFEMLAQLTQSQIRLGRLSEARETLDRLDSTYPFQKKDVRAGLRTRLLISQRKYEEALVAWGRLREQDRPVHLALRRDAIEGVLRGQYVDDERRDELARELTSLRESLKGEASPGSDAYGWELD
jgi:tetratricopeptide (TPR) repeat protein